MLAQLRTDQDHSIGSHHGLRRLVLLGLASALALVALLPGRAAAAPGTPGVPQAGTQVFLENFENTGNTPVAVSGYTGAGTPGSSTGADGATYTADPNWDGSNCDGWIFTSTSAQPPDGCFLPAFWEENQREAIALGEFDGQTPAEAAGNHIMAEFTGAKGVSTPGDPGPGVELQTTTNPIPTTHDGFFDITADYAVIEYQGTNGADCATLPGPATTYDPLIDFYLIDGATKNQVGTNIDPCTTPGAHAVNVGGTNIVVAKLVSNAFRWTGGSTMGIEQFNANGGGEFGNDGGTDNIQVVDVTPQLDKSFSPTTVTAGKTSTLTFTVTNTSELGAKQGWSFTDNLPSGLTVANPSGASTTCAAGQVTASGSSIGVSGNLEQGQAACTVSVNVTASKVGTYTNNAGNVTTDGLNPPGPTTVTFQDADVQIVKSASPEIAVPGENETYTLAVKNNGPAAAENTVVSDPLPTGLTFVSASPGCSFASGKVTCRVGTMASGATTSFTVVAKVPGSQTHRIANTATVGTTTPDSDEGNNSSTVETPVGPKVDLEILKTASAARVDAGGQVMYTLVVNDNGPSDATGVTVDDGLPAGLTLVSAQPSQGSCSGTKCELGTIVDGGSAQILVTANVSGDAKGNLTNTASVIGDQPDTNPKNNQDGSTIEIVNPPTPPQPESDIKIVKKVDHRAAFPGQVLTYTLTISNLGPDTASDVNLTDTTSLPLKVMSAEPSIGSCKVGRPLTCALGTVRTGGHETIRVRAKVTRLGVENNVASVTSGSKDPNPANNVGAARTKLTPRVLLRKTASPGTVTAGHEVTYHLAVTNPMDIAIRDVKVCDSLPAGMTYVSSNPKAKLTDGRSCWTLKALAAGKSKTITVLARALRGASGNLTNHATATAKGMRAVTAHATVHVTPAPAEAPTPVTG
jgi:uncharacterized repeat protein (TIGR01451 family)